jgi:hypothetical protein
MISWFDIAYGAALSALAGGVAVWVLMRERRVPVLLAAGLAAAAGPVAWNAILHDVGAAEFFVDAPIVVFPVSWQDTGSGVFATAAACLVLGFGPLRGATARTLATVAVVVGAAALVVDVYLY